MKKLRYTFWTLLLPLTLVTSSCEDLMSTESDERLSGDEFWNNGTVADVEAFVTSIYASFRTATLVNSAFLVNTGDLRCAPVVPYSTGNSTRYIEYLATNDLRQLMSEADDQLSTEIIRWKTFYEVIQSANILLEEIENVPDLSPEQAEGFKAEAIFMRNLTYFFLVRVFGDVPYYTNAYNAESLPRTSMLAVLQYCLDDLQGMLDNDPDAIYMPWVQPAAKAGLHANRGAVLTLMMHINMWMLCFDDVNSAGYYQNVTELGNTLVNGSGGAYYLLDINRNADIFRGGTAETFFEIAQNVNAEEVFLGSANFSNLVAYKYSRSTYPTLYYTYEFLTRIFPPDIEDKRRDIWFDDDIYQADGTPKEIIKFLNSDSFSDAGGNEQFTANAGNYIIFRYADALLLYAEALAMQGDEAGAREMVNRVRERAGAPVFTTSGRDLQDDIYWERVRELIGEGQYFFDLTRTGRIHDREYSYHVVTRANFNAGAWTWPIHPDAFINNTRMTYNLYWQ